MKHEIEITSLANGGDGIGRVDGQVVFIPFALPGDVVRARVVKRSKRALWAALESVVTPSPDRLPGVEPPGHAMWRHFSYPAQAAWKQRIVTETLARLGGMECAPAWVEEPAWRTGYRTRAEFHGDGRAFGFYGPGSHEIIDTASCDLLHPHLNDALARLRALALRGSFTVTVHPEDEDILVWAKTAPTRVCQFFPQTNTPRDAERHAFDYDGIPIVNGGFSQASLLLNRLLVKTVHAAVGEGQALLDLYCGSGNLSLDLIGRMRVTGIDHHRPSIDAAQEYGGNGYQAGDEGAMEKHLAKGGFDTVVLDPPRTGAKPLANALAACKASRIVYVSCDPATLARDLRALAETSWRLAQLTALDLFPHTPHVECVAVMER
ncbi:TRAM domain-containing protein [Roseovarius pacificus]|uniref:class I SAM-dependent RNA methyltransferase n=1 Tax=Roseovarius pacificus TaxID=337701 RepID=UPI002A18C882|nr:TRAM domain-containing protein [Roseovarius pacificus]